MVGTRDVDLVVLTLAGQTNSATTLELSLPTSGDKSCCGPWWSISDYNIHGLDFEKCLLALKYYVAFCRYAELSISVTVWGKNIFLT